MDKIYKALVSLLDKVNQVVEEWTEENLHRLRGLPTYDGILVEENKVELTWEIKPYALSLDLFLKDAKMVKEEKRFTLLYVPIPVYTELERNQPAEEYRKELSEKFPNIDQIASYTTKEGLLNTLWEHREMK